MSQSHEAMTGFAILSTTVETEADADVLAKSLVEARLAACVQIMPARSVYRWKEAVETAREHVLVCKIAVADFTDAATLIRATHTYQVPEIVMTPIMAATPLYLDWLTEATTR
jgi:periplasmic divalent cation tolerance protein